MLKYTNLPHRDRIPRDTFCDTIARCIFKKKTW